MNKTLIIYGTRKGTTTETVNVIAGVLTAEYNQEVEICDTRQINQYKRRINEFDNIVVGSSIISGRWKSRVLSFAKKNLFNGKKVAVFITAGGTLNKVQKYGIPKIDAQQEAILKYIDRYLAKFRFSPLKKAAFGGRVVKKGISKYDNWDKADIISWAKDIGKDFNEL